MLAITGALALLAAGAALAQGVSWQPTGWGGGGFYWAGACHPTQENTIYMTGDQDGVYKTTDLGKHWQFKNVGLSGYEIYGLAVSPKSPDTVFADSTEGLNRTTDGGEHWQPLPGAIALGVKTKRGESVRPVAVSPLDARLVYAGTPDGKICKSTDGGDTWTAVYQVQGPVRSVAASPGDANIVAAATSTQGIVLSTDAGKTWTPLQTPALSSNVTFAPGNPQTMYASFYGAGLYMSTDLGKTWAQLPVKGKVIEVAVSPANPDDVYAIATADWNGAFQASHDGGKTWMVKGGMKFDKESDPTWPVASATGPMSTLTNIAISPMNPKVLFISANWRPMLSTDSGETWTESDHGADISVVTDLQFHGGKTYASAMDEGVFSSDDNGAHWAQLWPTKFDENLSGHYWRLAVWDDGPANWILSTCTPWNGTLPNHVVISENGGKTFSSSAFGLPDYNTHANTRWGRGYMRAMAFDPKNPKTVYAGIDGDPASGNSGGGIFKSTDGGISWTQLPVQPGSRRMFFGLAVDPTDSQRIYWAACGSGGGIYRSEDGGNSWQHIFNKDSYLFNLAVSAAGTLYAPGKDLWKSTDHGKTWAQISNFKDEANIVGIETSPTDDNTIWISSVTWNGSSRGVIRKTTDGGKTWTDITGDIPYRKPLVLRYNPATHELWAAGTGIWKLAQ